MTTNRRIGWAALWLRASFCFREDILQLARTGHPWATSHRTVEANLLRRIRTLARRWEQASRRAHEILFCELDDAERAQAVLALGVLVECGYLPPDAVSGYLMAVVVLDREGQSEP